jgi:choline dehydrogenase-like flavoprotein
MTKYQDARRLDDKQVIDADICIIGAGPAGTLLAREFAGEDFKVVLLESGGEHSDHRTQQLSAGEVTGDFDEPVENTHLRQLGGTANHWIIKMSDKQYGYRYAPLNHIDFEKRDAIPYSGWPITREDLDPYYEKVHKDCRIGPYKYGPGNWETGKFKPIELNEARVVTDFFTFGPTRIFGQDFPETAAKAGNVEIYLHATVSELLSSDSGSAVETAVIKTFNGKTIQVKAKHFIIASGGFQTPRLLLNSRSKFANGLGNQNDVVGRYYIDHGLVPSGNLFPNDPRIINSLGIYDMRLMEGCSVLGKLSLSEEVMRKEGLRNFCATLFPMPEPYEVEAILSMKSIAVDLAGRKFPHDLPKHAFNMIKGSRHLTSMLYQKVRHGGTLMPGFGQGGWSKFDNNEKKYRRLELMAFIEQTPNPDNRVTLIDEKDELGDQKIRVHYQWSEEDLRSIARAQEIMQEELTKTGIGKVVPAFGENGGPAIGTEGLHHLMGTTRMADDPKVGVVDHNCTVHGVDNLHIASSSVFATGGYANPTITILALALRLADHLRADLKQ